MEGYIFEKLKIMGWTSVVLEIMKLSSAHISEMYCSDLSHIMRKPVYAICEQQRRRSACASAQSDQRLCCSLPR